MAVSWDIFKVDSISDAIGLIEAIDKNAHVYVMVKSNIIHTMTDENVK